MNGKTNQLTDLNDALFSQLARLDGAADEHLQAEIQRSGAMGQIAAQIIANARLALDAEKAFSAELISRPLPMLCGPDRRQ